MNKVQPSCKTIAKEAGVSRMTVSMALRDHPRVAPETRERIKEIAKRQGYTPDPNLTELMRYLRKRDISKEEPVIAILNPKRAPLKKLCKDSLLIREGVKQRAEELGFKTEDFWLHEPGMRLKRIVQILETRGIRGIVVLPVEDLHDVFSLPEENFTGVATCGVAAKLGYNQVHPHFYQSMHMGVSSLMNQGFKRIGFCITDSEDERSNHLYQSYLLWHQKNTPAKDRVPILSSKEITKDALVKWVKKGKPDVVLSPNVEHYQWLKEAGFNIPEDLSFAALNPATDDTGEIAQVRIGFRKIGATAVDLLKSKLANEQVGPLQNPAVTLIRGEWVDGKSVKAPKAPEKQDKDASAPLQKAG
ncbi:LacI family DNA-binding transcriptional regulator [Pelagicoccus sp. SDUM812005]|uniref:LacI family DNA-binding transcriptional regulator n=1 Tax=Pelagicoccus sp. SDUM812005 TaxID=3041257 RepID=UPI00280FCA44|nr:LacI family DNA-binding transcriptional regulator [Pelagicoccus sp. SDUM812005]MDQ8183105.1 LacI family DNA-binding transcriptional regulator [Pelagicoccus sp. SDUM812005]